jgi:hypothetical protein
MRAKVAAHAGGHAFEQRFLDLHPLQLRILFEHARSEEKAKRDQTVDLIRKLNDIWVHNFGEWFESLSFHSNPELFKKIKKLQKELADGTLNTDTVNEENFEEVWNELLNHIPSEVHIDLPEDQSSDREMSKEVKDMIVGWVPFNERYKGGE